MNCFKRMNYDEWFRYRDLAVELRHTTRIRDLADRIWQETPYDVMVEDRSSLQEWLDEEIAWQLQKGRVTERELPRWVRALPMVAEILEQQG